MLDVAAAPAALPLSQWLRLLWDAAPPLHLDSPAPFIAAGSIHLPARALWQQHRAAAAHAMAHLVYSPRRFEAGGLVPTARALLALLEDARVEALAMRELPGLARLWRPLHSATPASGQGSEALMARLARALADPDYRDPHPWVAKGRRLFFLDEPLGLPALCTPAALRVAALRLGHDLGQLRLPFNAPGYRPAPAYRDDHRWMWDADQLVSQPPAPQPVPSDAQQLADDEPTDAPGRITQLPEWDRLIHRLRPDWCRVIETTPASHPATVPGSALSPTDGPAAAALSRALTLPLRALTRMPAARGRQAEGDLFHLDALLAWATARRTGQAGDDRVYRARQGQAARAAVWLLVDQSASSAAPRGPDAGAGSVLQAATRVAGATALALQRLGLPHAVVAFRSSGRQAVRLQMLQALGLPADAGLGARLQALRPAGSTRLGAALRHASARLAAGRADTRWVLLISDGQPHDVDVHDPRYLVEDARHAVQQARRRGLRLACLSLAERPGPEVLRIFGRAGLQTLGDLASLPRALRRLLG